MEWWPQQLFTADRRPQALYKYTKQQYPQQLFICYAVWLRTIRNCTAARPPPNSHWDLGFASGNIAWKPRHK